MRRQLARGIALRAATTPVTFLLSLAGTWLAVGHLGPVTWGAVLLVLGLPLLLPFADMGVGAAVMNALSGERAEDRGFVVSTLHRAQLVLALVGLVIAAGGMVAASTVPLEPLLGRGIDSLPDARVAICVFCVVFGLNVALQLGTSILIGVQRNGTVMVLGVLAGVCALAGTGLGVALDAPVIWFLLVQPLAQAVAAVVALIIGLRLLRLRPLALLRGSRERVQVLSTALPMLIVSVGAALALNTDRLVVSHVNTAQQLAQYSIASQLYLPAWAAVASVLIVLWPIFNRMRAEEGAPHSLNALWSAVRLTTACAATMGIGFAVLAVPITAIISHGRATASWSLAAGFGALLFVQTVWKPIGVYLTDAAGLRFQAVCIGALGVAGIPLSVLGAVAIGPAGPVWASVIVLIVLVVVPGVLYVRARGRRPVPLPGEPPTPTRAHAAEPAL